MLQTMTPPNSDGRQSKSPSTLPAGSARTLEDLGATLAAVAALAHDRVTVKQSLFFITVAHANAMGQSITLRDVVEQFDGSGSLGRAIRKSYAIFLAPGTSYPDALDWLYQEEVPDDRRYRYLRLTDKGREVVSGIVEAHRGT